MTAFTRGKVYSRIQIQRAVGGGVQDYLPHAGGQVVAGCFSTDVNPDAPSVILPGTGVEIEKWARVFAQQAKPIPVFVKKRSNEWYCMGYFRCVELSEDPVVIASHSTKAGRDDVTMVLRLERDRSVGAQAG